MACAQYACNAARRARRRQDRRAPPDRISFEANPVSALAITNPSGTPVIKLTVGTLNQNQALRIRACKPLSQGYEVCPDMRELGVCPAAQSGAADITSLYTAKFGAPKAGQKLFVQAYQTASGWTDQPLQFSGIVPAST